MAESDSKERFEEAARLFEEGRLSSGRAARRAGMDRVSFLYKLGELGISAINLRDEELEAEIRAARELAGLPVPLGEWRRPEGAQE